MIRINGIRKIRIQESLEGGHNMDEAEFCGGRCKSLLDHLIQVMNYVLIIYIYITVPTKTHFLCRLA